MIRKTILVGVRVLALGLALAAPGVVTAGELRLRKTCQIEGPIVTLGDVAEIAGPETDETKSLADLELFPSPALGSKRYVTVREVQDALARQGYNLRKFRLAGSSRVELVRQDAEDKASGTPRVPPGATRQARITLERFLRDYLDEQECDSSAWNLDFEISAERAARVVAAREEITIDGGESPWTGEQTFEIRLGADADQPTQFELPVTISARAGVVVCTRLLAPGSLIHASDVELSTDPMSDRTDEPIRQLEDCIGRETTRSLAPGQILLADFLRTPLVVRKGEAVTVFARSEGIQVRTVGRAKDDGSLGDLITVESLANREKFFARVSGIQEVEVYARGADSSRSETSDRERASIEPENEPSETRDVVAGQIESEKGKPRVASRRASRATRRGKTARHKQHPLSNEEAGR